MKKLLLSIILVGLYSVSFSQLTVDTNGVDITGTTINISIADSNDYGQYLAELDVEITNTGSSALDIRVSRTNQALEGEYNPYTGHQMCIGGSCYLADIVPPAAGDPVTIAAGESEVLQIHVKYEMQSLATELYTVYENGNESNAITFTVIYNSKTVGINAVANNNFSVKSYPNPANNKINFNYGQCSNNSYITIHDITGKKVGSINLDNNQNTTSFNTENLQSGIYFYNIYINDVKVKTNKFIVRH